MKSIYGLGVTKELVEKVSAAMGAMARHLMQREVPSASCDKCDILAEKASIYVKGPDGTWTFTTYSAMKKYPKFPHTAESVQLAHTTGDIKNLGPLFGEPEY